ncbi:MAG TPA: phosphotransferase [Mycobacteriales bacterium]|nr:phosphotransferase [Mycobacteriales bacterium]
MTTAPREWDAEHEVDVALAERLVRRQFPHLAGRPVEHLASGWDNTVVLVDGVWVFRFPRRPVALQAQERELAVLPALAPRLPLRVPVPELRGRPDEGFPWPFTGARLVPGTELAESGLRDDARVAVAAAAGGFLRSLHHCAAPVPLPHDPTARGDTARRVERTRPWLDELAGAGLWQPDDDVRALLDEGNRLPPPTASPVLVHGDLHVRHLLVDGHGSATGVVDWGDVCLADPAVDLSLAWAAFTGAARTALLDAYGPVDAERELRARVLAVSLSAALAAHAAATGARALLRESLAGLHRAVTP